MIRAALLSATALLAACSITIGAREPEVVSLRAEIPLRAGVVRPAAESVSVNGATYDVTLIRGGGTFEYGQGRYADVVLVGGTDEKLDAVDVFLAQCYPGRAREVRWGDEYIPRLEGSGEWIFEYPEGCPARGSAPVG